MDDIRLGRLLRALRRRREMRQRDVAEAAGASQTLISLVERGHLASLSVARLRAVSAVEARFEGSVTWRGGAIDRLLDERHAVLVGEMAARLRRVGSKVDIEVTFNAYGDRGAIDILATRAVERVALVVEIKTELTAIDEMLRRLDVKERLAAGIVADRLGWRPVVVGRLVVLLETSTNRRRVAVHARVLDLALPARGVATRTWLRRPDGRLSGLLISSSSNGRAARRQANPSIQPGSTQPVNDW